MGYTYFDTPDGEDCIKKLIVATKYGATYGLFASALDVLAYSHPKGYGATIGRFGYITIPFIGITTTFAATTCLLTNVRNKDDNLNYLVGGAASGAIVGAWQKSIQTGSIAAVIFGILGFLTKQGLKDGWQWKNPDYRQQFGDFWTIRYDLSLTKERPISWVTDEK